jgi:S1-C subfamily serine protease
VGLIPCNVSIPIDLLYPILADLMKEGRSGKAQKPWLGINAEETKGRIFITKITSEGPAEKAGLKPGDIILTVDGQAVYGLSDFYRKVWAIGHAGIQVPLSILQGTKVREINVHSMDRYQHYKSESRKGLAL